MMTPIIPSLHKNKISADVHLHTLHSHGKNSTQEMLNAAKINGLSIIGFSEHSPRPAAYMYPQDYQERLLSSFPTYIHEVLALKNEHTATEILLGVEVDYIVGEERYAKHLCEEYPYDYIIGGLHFQGTWGFDWSIDQWNLLDDTARFAIYQRYYEDITRMCATGFFQIIAHPDLIKIFTVTSFSRWIEKGQPCVEQALIAIRDNKMAMEVSSAGLRKACQEIYPGPVIMGMARDLDVPISFASDAHCASTPAYKFNELAQYASAFGYTKSAIFRQKQPEFLSFSS